MNKTILTIIGLGRIGKVHTENLVYRVPEAEVIAVTDPDPATAAFAKQVGVPFVQDEVDNILANEALDAVIICSPTPTHLNLIEKAAQHGKHIFCEKPLEMTIDKIEQIINITKKHEVKLQVGFNRRFDANFRRVQQQVKNGHIGEPHILKITSRDPAPPPIEYIKSSGGMFMDMTVHDFDMARFVVGSEVVEVFVKGAVRVDEAIGEAGDIDTAVISLKFANGCLGVIDNSRQAVYGYDQRLEIFGSKGMSRIGNNYSDTEMLYDKYGRHTGLPLHFFMERYTEAYCEEMRAFVRAINQNEPVTVSGEDALAATRMALAAQQSLETNLPVQIS